MVDRLNAYNAYENFRVRLCEGKYREDTNLVHNMLTANDPLGKRIIPMPFSIF